MVSAQIGCQGGDTTWKGGRGRGGRPFEGKNELPNYPPSLSRISLGGQPTGSVMAGAQISSCLAVDLIESET